MTDAPCDHRRRRHRRACDGADAAPDRRALHRSSRRCASCSRWASASTSSPTRCASSTTSASAPTRSTPSASRRANGRWSGSTATTSMPSRAACSPATTGRNMRCTAASCTCCCTETVIERLGPDAVRLGHKVTGYRNERRRRRSPRSVETRDGTALEASGTLLVGADGIHSAVRAQMHPDQPPIHWGGAIMWRGTTLGEPIRTGASFVGLGTHRHRVVFYPISHARSRDRAWPPSTGSPRSPSTTPRAGRRAAGSAGSAIDDFIHHFEGWI